MRKYLRNAPLAARIEFAAGALWFVAWLIAAIAGGIYSSLNPPAPVVTNGVVQANPPVIQLVFVAILFGVAGALPSFGIGALLHVGRRGAILSGALLALVLSVLCIGGTVVIGANSQANGVDIGFIGLSILLTVTALLHAISGVVALRGEGHMHERRPAGA